MSRHRCTPEQIERMAEMREGGATYREIAAEMGCSTGAVAWHCLRLGADGPRAGRVRQPPGRPQAYRRGGHVVRAFTAQEDARLLAMEASGCRVAEICRALDRPHNSIKGRLMTLARHEERSGR